MGMLANKTYACAGFVFFVVSVIIHDFFPEPNKQPIIHLVAFVAFIASVYCGFVGACGVQPGGGFFHLCLLVAIVAVLVFLFTEWRLSVVYSVLMVFAGFCGYIIYRSKQLASSADNQDSQLSS